MPAIGSLGNIVSLSKDRSRFTVSTSVAYRRFSRPRTFSTSPYRVSFERSKLKDLFARTSRRLYAGVRKRFRWSLNLTTLFCKMRKPEAGKLLPYRYFVLRLRVGFRR